MIGMYEGVTPVLLLSDPELIKSVLVKDFASFTDNYQFHGHRIIRQWVIQSSGNEWRRTRSIITPTFTSGKMKAMLPLVTNSIAILEQEIRKHVKSKKKKMDAKHVFTCLTLDVIAKVAFASDVNAHENEDERFIDVAKNILKIGKLRYITGTLLPTKLKNAVEFSLFKPEHIEFLIKVIQTMLEQKRKVGHTQNFTDLGQLLMEARNDEGEALTEEEIISNAFLMLIAGFETTGMTILSILNQYLINI